VTVAVRSDATGATLTVDDDGPGIRPEDLPHVFERFYRAAAARGTPGSGLGLAIVHQAAEAHGGFAEAANAPGGGAFLRVSFGPALPLAELAVLANGHTRAYAHGHGPAPGDREGHRH
jgi:two-component system sensor histidine kinase MprB